MRPAPRPVLVLNDRTALAFDRDGWCILSRCIYSKTANKWTALAESLQSKEAVIDVLRDEAVPVLLEARQELDRWPERFADWYGARRARELARAGFAA